VRRRAAEKALFLKDAAAVVAPSVLMRAKLDYAAQVLGAPIDYAAAPVFGAAPVVQAAPVAQTKLAPAQRLTQILRSEPGTDALLLTQVVPADAPADDDEIVTAHAKPAARKIESFPSIKRDRRLTRMRRRATFFSHFAHLNILHSLEAAGLAALFLFGVGLTLAGGSMFYASNGDLVQIAGASAFAAPGLAAILLAGFGIMRGPQVRVAGA